MLALGLLVGGALVVVSPWVVPLIFGEKYHQVAQVLMILAICVPARFLCTVMTTALLSEKHTRYRVGATGFNALVVVVFNVLLIPHYHVMGAAFATVLGELSSLLSMYLGVRRFHAR